MRTTQLQHTLDVFAEEGCLNGEFVGKERVDDTLHTFEYLAQLQVRVTHLAQVDDARSDERNFRSVHLQHTIAHEIRTRVDAQNHLFYNRFQLFSKKIRAKIVIISKSVVPLQRKKQKRDHPGRFSTLSGILKGH